VLLVIATFCVVFLAVTYAGYPLLIGFLARFWPTPVMSDPSYKPTVTVCIPAYNVETYLEAKLRSVLAQQYPSDKLDILICSDGSTDSTPAICADHAAADPRVSWIEMNDRRGKPTAVNTLAMLARGDVLVFTDSRQTLSAGAVSSLVAVLAAPDVGCATGNLVLKGDTGSSLYWAYENWIRRQEGRYRSVVGVTGPLSALRKAYFHPLPVDIILDDVWLPMMLMKRAKRTVYVEAAVAYDEAFSDDREFGRKTRTIAGNYQLIARLPWVLVPWVNPLWMQFMLHKVFRLLCPWALILLLIASVVAFASSASDAMRFGWGAVVVAQLVFYGTAFGPARWRLTRGARTFVTLNWAAIVGLARYLRGTQTVRW
jgi:poly-beta-1,6-N-acetyl-D-glucosamine synthase